MEFYEQTLQSTEHWKDLQNQLGKVNHFYLTKPANTKRNSDTKLVTPEEELEAKRLRFWLSHQSLHNTQTTNFFSPLIESKNDPLQKYPYYKSAVQQAALNPNNHRAKLQSDIYQEFEKRCRDSLLPTITALTKQKQRPKLTLTLSTKRKSQKWKEVQQLRSRCELQILQTIDEVYQHFAAQVSPSVKFEDGSLFRWSQEVLEFQLRKQLTDLQRKNTSESEPLLVVRQWDLELAFAKDKSQVVAFVQNHSLSLEPASLPTEYFASRRTLLQKWLVPLAKAESSFYTDLDFVLTAPVVLAELTKLESLLGERTAHWDLQLSQSSLEKQLTLNRVIQLLQNLKVEVHSLLSQFAALLVTKNLSVYALLQLDESFEVQQAVQLKLTEHLTASSLAMSREFDLYQLRLKTTQEFQLKGHQTFHSALTELQTLQQKRLKIETHLRSLSSATSVQEVYSSCAEIVRQSSETFQETLRTTQLENTELHRQLAKVTSDSATVSSEHSTLLRWIDEVFATVSQSTNSLSLEKLDRLESSWSDQLTGTNREQLSHLLGVLHSVKSLLLDAETHQLEVLGLQQQRDSLSESLLKKEAELAALAAVVPTGTAPNNWLALTGQLVETLQSQQTNLQSSLDNGELPAFSRGLSQQSRTVTALQEDLSKNQLRLQKQLGQVSSNQKLLQQVLQNENQNNLVLQNLNQQFLQLETETRTELEVCHRLTEQLEELTAKHQSWTQLLDELEKTKKELSLCQQNLEHFSLTPKDQVVTVLGDRLEKLQADLAVVAEQVSGLNTDALLAKVTDLQKHLTETNTLEVVGQSVQFFFELLEKSRQLLVGNSTLLGQVGGTLTELFQRNGELLSFVRDTSVSVTELLEVLRVVNQSQLDRQVLTNLTALKVPVVFQSVCQELLTSSQALISDLLAKTTEAQSQQTEVAALKSKVEELHRQIGALVQHATALETHSSTLEELRNQQTLEQSSKETELTTQLQEFSAEKDNLLNEKTALSNQLEQTQEKLLALQSENQALLSTLEELRNQSAQLKQALALTRQTSEQLQREKDELQQRVVQLSTVDTNNLAFVKDHEIYKLIAPSLQEFFFERLSNFATESIAHARNELQTIFVHLRDDIINLIQRHLSQFFNVTLTDIQQTLNKYETKLRTTSTETFLASRVIEISNLLKSYFETFQAHLLQPTENNQFTVNNAQIQAFASVFFVQHYLATQDLNASILHWSALQDGTQHLFNQLNATVQSPTSSLLGLLQTLDNFCTAFAFPYLPEGNLETPSFAWTSQLVNEFFVKVPVSATSTDSTVALAQCWLVWTFLLKQVLPEFAEITNSQYMFLFGLTSAISGKLALLQNVKQQFEQTMVVHQALTKDMSLLARGYETQHPWIADTFGLSEEQRQTLAQKFEDTELHMFFEALPRVEGETNEFKTDFERITNLGWQ